MNRYKLPYRPILQQDESAASLLIRTAEGNGFENVLQLMSACGFKHGGASTLKAVVTDQTRYAELMNALGLNVDYASSAFLRSKPTRGSPRIFMHAAIPEKLFRMDASVFCPLCLTNNPYWRCLWSLRPYSVCHTHGVLLLDRCPNCSQTLALNRGRLSVCECGTDLTLTIAPTEDREPSVWLHDQLTAPSQKLLDECLSFWQALTEFDGLGENIVDEYRRLCMMRAWGAGKASCIDAISQMVIARAEHRNPRVQLLPFIKRKGTLGSMARGILSKINSLHIISNTGHQQDFLVTLQDAAFALGISTSQVQEFIKRGILTRKTIAGLSKARVSINEVEQLLSSLQSKSTAPSDFSWRPPNQSLADLIIDIQNGKVIPLGYDLDKGINYLKIKNNTIHKISMHDLLGASEASRELDIHPEILRSLVKKGWLSGSSQVIDKHKKLVIDPEEIARFNAEYVTAGALARTIRHNVTNFAEKLESIGVRPIAGPRIDGTLVYLFRRKDIVGVDLLSLNEISGYITRTGRPPGNLNHHPLPGVYIKDASRILEISAQKVIVLIRNGVLDKIKDNNREVRVTEDSFSNLLELLSSSDYLHIQEAADRLGSDYDDFRINYIETGIVKILDLKLWKLIHIKDFLIVKVTMQHRITAREAGKILGMHRSFLPNLEKTGLIKSYYGGIKRKVKFYNREDVLNLVKNPPKST